MSNLTVKKDSNIQTVSSSNQYQNLIELAITSNADIDKLERLMDLQERYEAKEAKKAYVNALAQFQAKCPTIITRKQGHNYKYAPMSDVVQQVGPLIAEHGLSYRFEQESNNGLISITCVVSHIDGHSERLKLESDLDRTGSKNTVQSLGSTITYLKRYSFLGSFGIATADEDTDARLAQDTGNFLNDSQIAEIEELMGAVEANREKFLKFFKANQVQDIAATSFNKAVLMLKAKGAK